MFIKGEARSLDYSYHGKHGSFPITVNVLKGAFSRGFSDPY